jgi:hypothetical protein
MVFISGYFKIAKALNLNVNYKIGSYGHMYSRINELKQLKDNTDILFLGSSHAYRGFDPRNFKDKYVFNLGSSSQTPLQTKILLERYLDKLNPTIAIYEVYPGTFSSDGVESSLDLIANDYNDAKTVKMALEINNIKTYNTLMYAAFATLLNLNKNFKEKSKQGKDTYIKGGFVESEFSTYKFINYTNRTWSFNQNQLIAFNECLELLKQKNTKVILVYAPITPRLYNSYTNNHYVDSTFSSYNLEYYNFNELMNLNDSLHFYDSHHLNNAGVTLFNNQLKKIIKL